MASDAVSVLPDGGRRLDFVTLGMFIIDEIHFPPPRKPEIDILGGAGSWSILGARLFRPSPLSKRLGWIVHKGSDFPPNLTEQIESWDTSCSFIDTPERLTTRGWNSYGDDEARAFKYTTTKIRIDETQLDDQQVLSRCFHLICTPTRCISLVDGLLERREKLLDGASIHFARPWFVWEPVPDACKPEELQNTIKALGRVDVVSPNHQELAALFGERVTLDGDGTERIRSHAERLLQAWPGNRGLVVVRCGEAGCMWIDGRAAASVQLIKPYHRPGGKETDLGDPSQVLDPTGAGNAFLGGFCAGLVDDMAGRQELVAHAVRCGTVAASFAIEQVGLPKLSTEHGLESWNGDLVRRRLKALKTNEA